MRNLWNLYGFTRNHNKRYPTSEWIVYWAERSGTQVYGSLGMYMPAGWTLGLDGVRDALD